MIINRLKSLSAKSLFTLLVCFISSAAFSAESDPLKVLFIGNSYTFMNDMPTIFEKIAREAGKKIHVEKSAQGGASFRVHSKRKEMYRAIRKEKWDYVILQGFSREMTFPMAHLDTATIPFINQIQDSIYANNSCTNIMFYMTWGYKDGFADREEINSYEKMADSVRVGYERIGAYYGLPVVPVGMVWKKVKENSKINLYHEDKAHPSRSGSYLIASTFFSAIFNEPIEKIYTSTIKTKTAKVIKKYMYEYVSQHRSQYHLDQNRFQVNTSTTKKGEFKLDYYSNFPEASKIEWKFGDGKSALAKEGTHLFTSAGTYIVDLFIHGPCGVRKYQTEVKYKPLKRPKKKKKSKPKLRNSSERKI